MILIWLVALAMAAAVTAAVLMPLVRRQAAAPPRQEYDLAVYRDQLDEIERDQERGLIQPVEAEAARVEVQRRMLTAAGAEPHADAPTLSGRTLAIAIGAAVPVAAFVLYVVLGSPDMPGQPFAARDAARNAAVADAEHGEMRALAARLADRLRERPDDLTGWMLLGRTYMTVGEYRQAATALERAVDISSRRTDVVAAYAEAMVLAEDGRLTPETTGLFQDVAEADPTNVQARYYIGLGLAQQGKTRDALQAWVDLKALAPADAPWLAMVDEQIENVRRELKISADTVKPSAAALELAKRQPPAAQTPAAGGTPPRGPSAADVEAAGQMTDAERGKMIQAMVARLAERLKQNPDDLEGWQRLARAYQVLGETDKAKDAQARVEALEKKAR
jgi:cytochrome c-type biogenesis protein CcmH